MSKINWVGNHIEVTPTKRPKKITATRFAAILGYNTWSTEFEKWCECTRTFEKVFDQTIFTEAGRKIEPLQAQYMVDAYGMDNLVRPTDIYGEDYFKTTRGDFFRDDPIVGGMWDYLLYENGEPTTVLEMKTTKRSEDWSNDVPEYYALQAALYAHLLGVDDVIMVCSFLSDKDYKEPEKFRPSVKNTITVEFKVSERYPDFADKVAYVRQWWKDHVETGVSPDFDEKRDAEILKELRTHNLTPDTDMTALLTEADELQVKLNKAAALMVEDEKRLDELKKIIKEHALNQFRDGDKKVSVAGARFTWEIARSDSLKIDEKALEQDGLLEKYKTKVTTSYRLTAKDNQKI